MENSYDVIIVGGRPAGASLAVRLAKGGARVLIVDRASFPSKPSVPSMPLVLPHTLGLLAEVGIDDATVARCGNLLKRLQLDMKHFKVEIDFAQALAGDSRPPHFYSIKRDLFDNALWDNLANYPTITRKDNFGVSKLLQDESGRVVGIEGANGESYHAKVVVGADGRFSFVASQMKAESFNEVSTHNTDFYFAYWRGGDYVHPDALHTMHVYSTLEGYQYLIFPVGENEVAVSIQMTHNRFDKPADQSPEDFYVSLLQKYPPLWNQIQSAERITQVWGIKNVRNGYREVGGAGWALVGDAVHYKDSIDAQGIYDAQLTAKLLATVLLDYHAGKITWEDALTRYRATLLEETYDMFLETQGRLKREVYDSPPPFVVKNIIRRAMQDPLYQEKFVGYVTRRIAPKGWASPALMLGAVARGIGRDIRGMFR